MRLVTLMPMILPFYLYRDGTKLKIPDNAFKKLHNYLPYVATWFLPHTYYFNPALL